MEAVAFCFANQYSLPYYIEDDAYVIDHKVVVLETDILRHQIFNPCQLFYYDRKFVELLHKVSTLIHITVIGASNYNSSMTFIMLYLL